MFSFLIKKSRQKAIEIETALLYSLGNPKGHTLNHFFYASHSRHNFPPQTDTYIDKSVEIFLKLSMKTIQVHLIIWTTLQSVNFDKIRTLFFKILLFHFGKDPNSQISKSMLNILNSMGNQVERKLPLVLVLLTLGGIGFGLFLNKW